MSIALRRSRCSEGHHLLLFIGKNYTQSGRHDRTPKTREDEKQRKAEKPPDQDVSTEEVATRWRTQGEVRSAYSRPARKKDE
jgi:hypothetical protein